MKRRILLAILLTLSLFACSTRIETEYVVKRPPPEYYDKCPIPKFLGTNTGHLQLYAIELQGELKKCNLQSEQAWKWFDEVELQLNEGNG